MELNTIKDAFDRVAKKQKLSCSRTQEVIDQIVQEVEKALQMLQSDPTGYKLSLTELKNKLQEIAPLNQLEGMQKEVNMALSKFPKALEKFFNSDISKAYRDVVFDSHTVNEIIAQHLYRHGLFDVGDCFIRETGETEATATMRSSFEEMYQIVQSMKSKNLLPALKWADVNSGKLKDSGSDLQLKLHRLQFVEILQKGNRPEALKYVRTYIVPFADNHMSEFLKLVGSLCWAGKLQHSPYAYLLSPTNWEVVAEELIRQFCNLLGQSSVSPLSVTIAAGVQGLPLLLKYISVMTGKKHDWQSSQQLPVPVELDKEFQFHSVFVCPVSKEQSTDDNPPMLMSCGHVLCKQSITKMSKNNSRSFKCPYCPSDIDAIQCRQLHF